MHEVRFVRFIAKTKATNKCFMNRFSTTTNGNDVTIYESPST